MVANYQTIKVTNTRFYRTQFIAHAPPPSETGKHELDPANRSAGASFRVGKPPIQEIQHLYESTKKQSMSAKSPRTIVNHLVSSISLISAILFGSGSPAEAQNQLLGNWSAEYSGYDLEYQFHPDGTYRFVMGRSHFTGRFSTDATKRPAWLDLERPDGTVWRGVYDARGNELRIGHHFESNRTERFFFPNFIAKRVTPAALKSQQARSRLKQLGVYHSLPEDYRIAVSGDGLAAAILHKNHVQIRNLRTGELRAENEIKSSRGYLRSAALNHDGTVLVRGTTASTVEFYDASNAKLKSIKTVPSTPTYLGYSPTGQEIAAGCSGGEVVFFDANSLKQKRVLSGHESAVRDVQYGGTNASIILTYSYKKASQVILWDRDSGDQVTQLSNRKRFWNPVLHPSENTVFAITKNTIVRWSSDSNWEPDAWHEHPSSLRALCGGGQSGGLIVATTDGSLLKLATKETAAPEVLARQSGNFPHTLICPWDGQSLVAIGKGDTIGVWDLATSRPRGYWAKSLDTTNWAGSPSKTEVHMCRYGEPSYARVSPGSSFLSQIAFGNFRGCGLDAKGNLIAIHEDESESPEKLLLHPFTPKQTSLPLPANFVDFAVSPKGDRIAIADKQGIEIWDVQNKSLVGQFNASNSRNESVTDDVLEINWVHESDVLLVHKEGPRPKPGKTVQLLAGRNPETLELLWETPLTTSKEYNQIRYQDFRLKQISPDGKYITAANASLDAFAFWAIRITDGAVKSLIEATHQIPGRVASGYGENQIITITSAALNNKETVGILIYDYSGPEISSGKLYDPRNIVVPLLTTGSQVTCGRTGPQGALFVIADTANTETETIRFWDVAPQRQQ